MYYIISLVWILAAIFLVFSMFIYLEKGLAGFKNIWDYFFDAWEISIEKRGSETWHKYFDENTAYNFVNKNSGVIPGSEYQRDFVVYKKVHKFNKKEKIVKEYLN